MTVEEAIEIIELEKFRYKIHLNGSEKADNDEYYEVMNGFVEAYDTAIKALEKIRKARKIIDDACFQHIVMSRADVLDEMFKNNLGEVADSVAEMNNVIYEVLEVLGNDT